MRRNMNLPYSDLLQSVPETLRKLLRKFENISKKLININWSCQFNAVCLKEDILPKFTRIRHYDPATPDTEATLRYRRYLVKKELESKRKLSTNLEQCRDKLLEDIKRFDCDDESKTFVFNSLEDILLNFNNTCKTRILKKLNCLYQGREVKFGNSYIFIKDSVNSFINLSDYELESNEKEFLNLGLNCHLQPKYNKVNKQVEIEVLYQSLLKLEDKNEIRVKPEMADQLRCEGTKHRNGKYKAS